MDVSDVDTATAESKAADATTMSPTTSTSSDASRNRDQSESQFVFQEQAPTTSDSTPPSPQHISTANQPPIPGVTNATYSGYGFQEQFLQSVQPSMEDVRQGTSQRVVPQALCKSEKCWLYLKDNSSTDPSHAKVRLLTVRVSKDRRGETKWLVVKGVSCEPLAESPQSQVDRFNSKVIKLLASTVQSKIRKFQEYPQFWPRSVQAEPVGPVSAKQRNRKVESSQCKSCGVDQPVNQSVRSRMWQFKVQISQTAHQHRLSF
uniref:OSJNBa0059H15.10 protein n=1 Tax=Oryza sativa subsp. japonica TaxID=39947 RepID=Q7XXH9_ORYSJ|nr:OSJNBa0059H15.10 [Oryza sativa Japonica Group]